MPRYVVERTFPDGLRLSTPHHGAEPWMPVVERNADAGVTWLHSYVSDDRRRTFCVYDAPTPEAIRTTSGRNGLPVDRITRVSVLDAYPYTFTGTATIAADGSTQLTGHGAFHGGTGACRGATGTYAFHAAIAAGSSLLKGGSAGTLTY